jgi:hypothetical protein
MKTLNKKEIVVNSKKKLSPKEKERLQMIIDFFKQNKVNPRSGQLVGRQESSTNICNIKDLKN